jgi:predicted RNase H-like HicB family nuclease
MKSSTTYHTTWQEAPSTLTLQAVSADLSVADAFYEEQYVTVVQPADLGLLWPIRLTVERDEGIYIVSDDLTEVYAEGETQQQAVAAYREALGALRRVLAAREPDLTPELRHRLAVLQSIVPPGD